MGPCLPPLIVGILRVFLTTALGISGPLVHERLEARKVDPHAPADPRRLQLPATDVAPQGGVRKTAVALRLRVADPLLLDWLFQQRRLLFVLFLSVNVCKNNR